MLMVRSTVKAAITFRCSTIRSGRGSTVKAAIDLSLDQKGRHRRHREGEEDSSYPNSNTLRPLDGSLVECFQSEILLYYIPDRDAMPKSKFS